MSNRVYVPGLGYVDSSSSRKPTWDPGRKIQGGAAAKPVGFEPEPPTTGAGTGSTGKRSSMASAYGVDAGDPIVSFPNMNWYYSSADVYGSQDPASPRSTLLEGIPGEASGGATPMWNFGLTATEAEKAFDDDTLVPPGLRDVLDKIAKSIHPLKGGRSIWEESVAASAIASQRGEYVSPYAILRKRYLSDDATETRDGEGPTSRSYSRGGGGYGGGGGGSVSLTDPTSARGLLMQTMQGVLGRNPTNQEYRQFLDILNESEMSNPRTVSFEGDVAVQSGGVDPSVLALEFAQDQEDFTERQGDQYFQTFMRSLAGGV